MGSKAPISTPEEARAWIRENKLNGADGVKFGGQNPDIMAAALDENKKLGMQRVSPCATIRGPLECIELRQSRGLTSMEHWYGLPEALFDKQTVQNFPLNYNYTNEQDRFSEAGRLWKQAAAPLL